jgi:5-(carboxyamino)imidazole ribonucleotide synthase
VAETLAAWAELGGVPCVVEHRLDLATELSVIVGRTASGDVEAWPVAENRHVEGILDVSAVPATVSAKLADRAIGVAMAIADALGYVGVLAVELFVVDGALLVNELAPRPHNSGHWTLDASVTSQYEQQVRAVCGLGLGSTAMTAPAIAMVNLLGDLWEGGDPDWTVVFDDPHAKLHLYGKTHARPGRKMGHLTVTAPTTELAIARALEYRTAATAPR